MIELETKIVNALNGMQLLSQSALHLLRVIEDKDHCAKDVVEIIERDTALTAEVLKVTNSASRATSQSIESISQAVVYVGEKEIFRIAMIHALMGPVYKNPLPIYENDEGGLWSQSLKTAIASKQLAKFSKYAVNPDIAFTSGLLADIGKTVIGQFLMEFKEDIEMSLNDDDDRNDFLLLERKMIGTDHCRVGAALARKWKLPPIICDCIRYHHDPSMVNSEHKNMTYIIHLAQLVSMMGCKDQSIDCMAYSMDRSYPNFVEIKSHDMARLILDIESEVEKIKDGICFN